MITGHRYMIIETCKGAAFSLSARDISPTRMEVNQLMSLLLEVHILFLFYSIDLQIILIAHS